MPQIVAHSGVLVSRDVTRAMTYWRDVFGFVIDNTFGEPPTFAILKRDGAYVMLGATADTVVPRREQRESLFDAYFWLDDAATEFAASKARGAQVDYEPCLQPYGVLEFGLLDPDNHLIGFGQVMNNTETKGDTQ
jgi:predicted enzyme related to lactoylglutathione lyase